MVVIFSWIAMLVSILSGGYADAKNDLLGNRFHVIEVLELIAIVVGFVLPLMFIDATVEVLLLLVAEYTLLRIGLFNLTYNRARGLDYKYVGNTDGVFDKFINKLPNVMVMTIYIVAIFFSGVMAHLIVK